MMEVLLTQAFGPAADGPSLPAPGAGLDPALRGLVDAPDGAAADQALAALLHAQAVPLIRRVAARKLRSCPGAGGSFDDDLHDITSDVLLALVSRLQSLREAPQSSPIACFEDYTAAVTYHAFSRYVRRRHPQRSRLKARLRYVLTRPGRLSLWATADGLTCGLAVWRPREPSAQAAARLERLEAEPDRRQPWTRAEGTSGLTRLLGAVFEAVGGPVDFDRLVEAVAALIGGADTPRAADARALDSLPDRSAEPADLLLDRRRLTAGLWREIVALPLRQRAALLLNLRDPTGAGLLWVLPAGGIATVGQIARALEMPERELAELWSVLPLTDLAIAVRLGCTRQQVINLRACARKRLARRLPAPAVEAAGA
jgi:hypothetical protein